MTATMAVAVLLAADRETLNEGSPEQVGIDFELRQEEVFAVALGECGLALEAVYPSHR